MFCLKADEVPVVYKQTQEYFKNGIEILEEDIVFDVGANIGLFALRVFELGNKKVNVYAFEPIPDIFKVLQQNAHRFAPGRLKVFPYGLSKESKSQIFSYYHNVTVLSTAYPDDSKEEREKFKKGFIADLKNFPPPLYWLNWLPPFMRSLIVDIILKTTFQQVQVTCQVKTISEIIREHDIQQIDLLKIDVEKSELDVLLGIETSDWSKIKQIVIEVHDLEGRVDKVTSLLKENGFAKIAVEQEESFKGSDIFNLYALR